MQLDHLAICAQSLEAGVAWAEARLGVPMGVGGEHPRYGTHNRLLGFAGGLYLEVIAIDPDAVPHSRPRWFDLDTFQGPPRLANWICRVPSLRAALASLPECGEEIAMTRGGLSWDISVPSGGGLPMGGGLPTVLQWHTKVPPGDALVSSGLRLVEVIVSHPRAAEIGARISVPLVSFKVGDRVQISARIAMPGGEVIL